jgi:hypothetical protein
VAAELFGAAPKPPLSGEDEEALGVIAAGEPAPPLDEPIPPIVPGDPLLTAAPPPKVPLVELPPADAPRDDPDDDDWPNAALGEITIVAPSIIGTASFATMFDIANLMTG